MLHGAFGMMALQPCSSTYVSVCLPQGSQLSMAYLRWFTYTVQYNTMYRTEPAWALALLLAVLARSHCLVCGGCMHTVFHLVPYTCWVSLAAAVQDEVRFCAYLLLLCHVPMLCSRAGI